MKSFLVCVVLSSLLLCQVAVCEDTVEDASQKNEQPAKELEEASSPKTKRGILHHTGYPLPALSYNVPLATAVHPHYGFQKPWHHVTYAKTPFNFSPSFIAPPPVHHHSIHHSHPVVHTAPAPLPAARPHLLITPGGASVTSYNVNYPRYAFYAKPQYHFDSPVPNAPRPTIFFQQPKPIIPVAVPAFSNRIPTVSRPTYHHVVQTLPAPAPVYPVASGVPHIHQQFIPVQPTIATIPTTFSTVPTLAAATPVVPVLPAGTHHHHFGAAAPQTPNDAWRPIFVSPTPTQNTFATPAGRPSISLLPPFGSAPAGAGAGASSGDQQQQQQQQQHALFHQQQLQQQFETSDFGEQQLNQLYGPPAADDHHSHQDFIQGNQQLLQAQLEQQQQQRAIIQEQQQIHAAGPFNGQGYEPPSNNGHYGGPSSYEVQLNSYTQA